jgi:ADP-heptose:LPS heptosyltransferase
MKNIEKYFRHLNHMRIDFLRSLKLKIFSFVLSPISRFQAEPISDNFIILRMDDKLGDSITATGFLRELKLSNPNQHICVVAGASTLSVYQACEFIDEVILAKKGVFNTISLFFKLNRKNYLYIINTSHILNPRVIFLTSLLKAYKKITFENFNIKLFSDHIAVDFVNEHITERYRKIFSLLGLEAKDLHYSININDSELIKAKAYVSELKKKFSQIIILNSFAGARLRNFNETTSKNIVESILVLFPQAVVISIANEGDHRILSQWIDKKKSNWIHNNDFKTIEENAALLSVSDLIITPDTAWVHIASALNKKLVAIYREETNPNEINSVIWAPYKTQFEIVFAPSTLENPNDINNVTVTEISQKAFKLLGLK